MTAPVQPIEEIVAFILGHGFSNTSFDYLRSLISPVLIKVDAVETAVEADVKAVEAAVEPVVAKVEAVATPVVKEAVVLAKPVVTAASGVATATDARITAAMQGLAADLKKAVEKDKVVK